MGELTRRGFVKKSGGAAASVAAFGVLGAAAEADAKPPVGAEPVLAYVRNPRSGEISLMHGEHEVSIHDRRLAAAIARAAN